MFPKNKSLPQEFSEGKNQREKKNYLRRALNSVQIHRIRGINYLALRCSKET
jgi:hypothetical protein